MVCNSMTVLELSVSTDLSVEMHWNYVKFSIYKGLKFRKVGSRKLYAVRESDMKDSKRRSTVKNMVII